MVWERFDGEVFFMEIGTQVARSRDAMMEEEVEGDLEGKGEE